MVYFRVMGSTTKPRITPESVANEVIKLAKERMEKVTVAKIHCVIYFAQGLSLEIFSTPMIKMDIPIQKDGPRFVELEEKLGSINLSQYCQIDHDGSELSERPEFVDVMKIAWNTLKGRPDCILNEILTNKQSPWFKFSKTKRKSITYEEIKKHVRIEMRNLQKQCLPALTRNKKKLKL